MKLPDKKYIALLLLILPVLLLFPVHAAHADDKCSTELIYPTLPFVGTLTGCSTVSQYIAYIFALLIGLAGAMGVLSIIISAAQILLSPGSEKNRSAARERIMNAAVGIGVLMLTFILLRTINPDLTILNDNPIVNVPPGLYWVVPNTDPNTMNKYPYNYKSVDQDIPDLSAAGYSDNVLFYYCPTGAGTDILLYLYRFPNFEAFSSADGNTVTLHCGYSDLSNPLGAAPNAAVNPAAFGSIESLRWRNVGSGVYYYSTPNCTKLATFSTNGDSTGQITSGPIPSFGTSTIGPGFPIQSFRIENSSATQWTYGVMFYSNNTPSGECSTPVTYKMLDANGCFSIATGGAFAGGGLQSVYDKPFTPLYAQIFRIAPTGAGSNAGSNFGVTFYSDHLRLSVPGPDIDNAASQTGYYGVPMGGYGLDDTIYAKKTPRDPSKWQYCPNNNPTIYCIPDDECNRYADLKPGYTAPPYPTDPGAYYPNIAWTKHGYNSCLSEIGVEGNYAIILYEWILNYGAKPKPTIEWIGCHVYTDNVLLYDSAHNATTANTNDLTQPGAQEIYDTVILPVSP